MPFDDPITKQLFKPGWSDGLIGLNSPPDVQGSGFSPFPEGEVFKPTPQLGDVSTAQSLKGSGLSPPVQPAPVPGPTDWGGVAQDIGTVFTDLPTQFKGGLAAQFQPSEDIGTPGTLTDWSKSARSLAQQRQQEPGGEQVVIPGINVTRQDIRDLPTNLGFSGVSQLTGLTAGLGAALIPGVNRIAKPTGLAASGMSAYKQAKHQLLSDVLDAASQGAERPLSENERTHLLNKFDSSATEHGLWEAIPEVAGEAFALHAITKPLKKTLTKAFGETAGLDVLGRLAKMYGVEIGTEAITQHGQHNVGVRAGLESGPERSFLSPSDLVQSIGEVAPPTFLQTTVMGGLGLAGRRALDLMHSEQAQKTLQGALGEVATPGSPSVEPAPQAAAGLSPWPEFQPPYEVQPRQPGVLPVPPPYSTAPKQPLAERPPLPFIGMEPIQEDQPATPNFDIEGVGYNGLPFVDLPFQSARGLETANTPSLGIQDLSELPEPPPFAFGGENWNRFPGEQSALSPESAARKPVAEPSTTPVVTQESQPFGTKPGVELETKPTNNLSWGQTNAQQVTSPETIYGGVRPRMAAGEGGVPIPGGVQGVQPGGPAGGQQAQPTENQGAVPEKVVVWQAANPPASVAPGDKGPEPKKITPASRLNALAASSDALQKNIDELHDRLDSLGIPFAEHETQSTELQSLYEKRISTDSELMGHVYNNAKIILDEETKGLPEKSAYASKNGIINDAYSLFENGTFGAGFLGYTNQALENPEGTKAKLAKGIEHLIFDHENPGSNYFLTRGPEGGRTRSYFDNLQKRASDIANRVHDRFVASLIEPTQQAQPQPQAASPARLTGPQPASPRASLTELARVKNDLEKAGYKIAYQSPTTPRGVARLRKSGYQSYVYDQSGNLVDHPNGLGVWAKPPVATTQKQKTSPTQEDSIHGTKTNVTSQPGHDAGTNAAHGAVQNAPEVATAQSGQKATGQETLLKQPGPTATERQAQPSTREELPIVPVDLLKAPSWVKGVVADLRTARTMKVDPGGFGVIKRRGQQDGGGLYLTNAYGSIKDLPAEAENYFYDGQTKPGIKPAPESQTVAKPEPEQPPSAIIKSGKTANNSQEQPSAARRQRRTTRKTEENTNVAEPKTIGETNRVSHAEPRAETVSRAETEREAGTVRRESSRGNAGRTGTGNEPSSNRSGQEWAGAPISSESTEVSRGPTANLERDTQDVPRVPARNRGDDYRIQPGELTRDGSWLDAAKGNVDAVELVSFLEKEQRQPTKEEQSKLLKFVGWGPGEIRNNLFPSYARIGRDYSPVGLRGEWRKLGERVEQIFTDEDWRTVARSTQYAHYTAEPVVRSIYRGLEQLGFTGGSVIEPGAGIGLFAGLMPDGIYRNSSYIGIEMDGFSAKIAQLLNPNQTVKAQDYIKAKIPVNFFDLAIGNPPFADIKVLSDPAYRKHGFLLHDYFFAKTLDSVRPGGLLAFITSNGTMDKKSTEARDYLIERADLIGAIRLPKTAFQQNAGTEVVTDIIFLRKRSPGEATSGANWRSSITEIVDGVPQSINEYFVAHPDMVLGTHSSSGTMYRANSYTVLPKQGDLQQQLNDAMDRLPKNIYSVIRPQVRPEVTQSATIEKDFNPIYQKEGGVYLTKEGELMRVEQGVGTPLGTVERLQGGDNAFLRDYVGLRDALKQAHHDQLVDGDWKTSLQALNGAYDGFVGKHGPIKAFSLVERKEVDADGNATTREERRYKNYRVLRMDAEYTRVLALEDILDDGSIVKGKGLLDRVLKRPMVPKIETASDAVAVSLSSLGRFDIDHAASIFGVSKDEMVRILGDLVFQSPNGQHQLADEYLSGNVKNKLDEARIAAAADQNYQRNVDALEKVQPPVLGAADVTVQLGAAWIPAEDVADFARNVLKIKEPGIAYSKATGSWTVLSEEGPRISRSGAAEWGTADRSPVEILDSVLNKSPIRIYRTEGYGKDKRTVFDQEATVAVNDLAKRMADEFQGWAFMDGRRAQRLLGLYNENFNLFSPRNFDGGHINPPGMSSLYSLHDHQKRTIWRQIASGNTYLAHAVGAGKSLEMIIGGMEQKRLGLIRKPMYVVPNHMLTQFAGEFMEAYPAANIMVADSDSFHTDKRRSFVAQAALNDPDAVILSHSAFGLLKLKPENMAAAVKETLDQLREQLEEELDDKSPASRRSRSQIEKRIERLEQQISAKTREEKKDSALYFEDLGVDYLYVDEAHEFRKLDFVTNMKVKGLDPQGSQRALDLYAKTKWLNKQRPGRSFSFASGTPITNTMAEMYSIQRFFQEDLMKAEGIHHFDAWASMFGKVAKFYERNATGELEVVERFGKFVNVYDMMSRALEFMDTLTSKQLAERFTEMRLAGKPVLYPEVRPGNAGRRNLVSVPKSSQLDEYLTGPLATRLKESREWKPSKDEPNNPDPVINIITDGRLASIDYRFVDPKLRDDPGSKLNRMIDEIARIYKETAKNAYIDPKTQESSAIKGAAQIVFASAGFGDAVIANRGFDSRAWVMRRLKEKGIKPSEVAWIWDYKTPERKQALFKAVRDGQVRVMIGSPKNMGTGVNAQQRLIALHHLDAPWYPSDLEQPEGRIVRQGNQNKEVEIYGYATDGTYDSTMWSMVARKSGFIEQAFRGDRRMRTMDDIGEASQYSMAAAIASGDQRYIRLAELEDDVSRLEMARKAHNSRQHSIASEIRYKEYDVSRQKERLTFSRQVDEAIKGRFFYSGSLVGTVDGNDLSHAKSGETGKFLMDAWRDALSSLRTEAMTKATETRAIVHEKIDRDIGWINGLTLHLTGDVAAQTKQDGSVALREDKSHPLRLSAMVNRREVFELWNDRTIPSSHDEAGAKFTDQGRKLNYWSSEISSTINVLKDEINELKARLGAPFAHEQEYLERLVDLQALRDELLRSGKQVDTLALGAVENTDVLMDEQSAMAAADMDSEGGGQAARFSLREDKGIGLSVRMVEQKIAGIPLLKTISAQVRVVADEAGLPRALQLEIINQKAEGKISAAFHGGAIYLVASNLKTAGEVEEAVLHEIAHLGVRKLYGPGGIQALRSIYNAVGGDDGIRALAKSHGFDMEAYFKAAEARYANDPLGRRVLLADELLAHLNQHGPKSLPAKVIMAIRQFIGAVKAWMRQNGLAEFAKWSDSDLAHELRRIMDAAKSDADLVPAGATRFHQVWHGSPHTFERFDLQKIGTGEGNQAYGWGLYFADQKNVAEWYRDKISSNEIFVNNESIAGLDLGSVITDELYKAAKTQDQFRRDSRIKRIISDLRRRVNEATERAELYKEEIDEQEQASKSRIWTKVENKAIHGPDWISNDGYKIYTVVEGERYLTESSTHYGTYTDTISGAKEAADSLLKENKKYFLLYEKRGQNIQKLLVMLENGAELDVRSGGKLYQVELAPKQEDYLDWDKPLSAQSAKVKEILQSKGFDVGQLDTYRASLTVMDGQYRYALPPSQGGRKEMFDIKASSIEEAQSKLRNYIKQRFEVDPNIEKKIYDSYNKPDYAYDHYYAKFLVDGKQYLFRMDMEPTNSKSDGAKFYRDLVAKMASEGKRPPEQAASEYLNSIGIPGIRYLAGTSRRQGEGAHNYVIFDDRLANIESRFLFAGKRSATADKEALEAARKFSLAGYNEENVRQATGWHQGADGQWRFEIDDSQASLRLKPQETSLLENGSSVAKALGSLVNHKDLFAAYPQLHGVWVKIIPGMEGGSFDARNKAIEIGWNGADQTLNGLLHEIQHSIQSVEGFARGGNFRAIMDHAFATAGDSDQLSEAVTNELGSDDLKSLLAKADEARRNNDLDSAKKYQTQASYLAAYRVYSRLAGEVEARNVQARQDLTATERRNIPPEFTADIPLEQQVVLFRDRLMSEGMLPEIEGMKEEMAALKNPYSDTNAKYMAAVKSGDMETARKMVKEAAEEHGYVAESNYKMQHQAPNREDYNLATVKTTDLLPQDYWDRPDWYQATSEDRESFFAIKHAIDLAEKHKANGILRIPRIWVYRAIPKTVNGETIKEENIRNGDWVTPSRRYAENEGNEIPHGYKIISTHAKITDLWWDGNSAAELGYDDGKGYAYKNTKNNKKLLDAVTYDDEGNIIPLSKRFNYRSDDIRFQMRPETQENYKADLAAQMAILSDEAVRAGYKTIDDWAQSHPDRFLAMAAQWRDDHPMRFSMAAEGTKQPGSIGGMADKVRDTLSDWLTYPGSKTRPGWWDKSVGTMRNLAKKSPEFKRVLDLLERSNFDSTRLASQAEKLAPLWFRDLSSGIRAALTTGTLNSADQKAVSEALWAITTGEKRRYDINTEEGRKSLAQHGLTTEQQLKAYDQAMKAVELATDQSAKSFAVRMGQTHHLDQGMLLSLFEDSRNIAELRQNMDDWVRGGAASPDVIGEDTKGNQVYSLHWLQENKAIVEKAMQQMRKEKAGEEELRPYQDKLDAINKMIKGHEALLKELQNLQAKVWKLGQEGYVPLMRFGRYVVAAVDENGKHQPDLPFLMFETKHEANRAAREMRRQGLTIRQETMNPDQWKMFEGISPEAVSAFAEFLPEEMQEIFQQWVKHAVSDSSALNRLLHRKEVPGWYPDAQRVLAQYLVSSARLASRNLHGMSIDRAVRDIKQGDTQQQAQKLVEYLRNPEEEYPGIRNFLFFWYLGGSISSAITNMTQPVLTTAPFLSKYGLSAPSVVAKWMAKVPTGFVPERFKSDMQRAIDEGLVSPQEIHNLMATARGGPLSGGRLIRSRPVQIGLLGWGSLFSLAEQFNRRVTLLSALEMAEANPEIVKAAGFKDRYEFAKNAIEETQFVYARWNRPAWARGKAAILFAFKQFTIQYLEFIKALPMPQRVLALSLLAMAAGMTGLPGEEDVEDILDTIGQWLGYPTNSRAWLMNHVPGVILNGLQDLGLPFDIQAKLGLGNVIPGTGALIPSKPDRARDVADVFGAAGNLVSSLAQSTASATKGDVSGALSMMAPRAVSAFLKGIDMASSGIAKDQAGHKITDVTGFEAAMKFANFTPRSVSKIQQAGRVNLEIRNYFQMREDAIADQLARARVDGDEALAAKARKEWKQWNADHPDTPIRITGAQIRERVRALVTNKQARVIKSLPREIRGEGRRIFEEASGG